MHRALKTYVRYVERINLRVGRFSMYLVFVMIGLLLFESISRTIFNTPHIWVVEVAQFLMAAYYLLGGGYSMILEGHVRMDLLYGRWSEKKQAFMDILTAFVLIFYLVFLFFGSLSSLQYALEYGQKNYTPWAPSLWPIKMIMSFGILLMLLQAFAVLLRDVAKLKGEEI